MRNWIRSSFIVGIATLVAGTAFGGSAKGKPFIELEGQIVEVQGEVSDIQDQVESLVAEVDSIEDRVTANQAAIDTLVAANSDLQALIATSSTDIASIQATIDGLQAETLELQQQVANSSGDVSSLEQQIADNEALIVNLQSALVAVENGMITLETDLQSQIDQNLNAINALQFQINDINSILALKQNHLAGQCGEGYALQAINPDGSIFCTSVSGGNLEVGFTQAMFGVNYQQHRIVSVSCNPGWLRTGGGFRLVYFIQPTRVAPVNHDTVEIGAVNWENINNSNFAYAYCMRFVP